MERNLALMVHFVFENALSPCLVDMTPLTRSHHTVYVKFCVNQIGFQIVGVPAKRGWKLRLFGRWSCLGSPAVRSTRERWCRPAPPACFAQSRLSPHPKLSSTSHGSWHAAVVEPPSSSEGRLRCVHRCSGTHLPYVSHLFFFL